MLGLAKMACRLADKRVGRDTPDKSGIAIDPSRGYPGSLGPVDRATATNSFMWDSSTRRYSNKRCYEASYEYYQIIDRISRGEQP